jgi:hypothetical protein
MSLQRGRNSVLCLRSFLNIQMLSLSNQPGSRVSFTRAEVLSILQSLPRQFAPTGNGWNLKGSFPSLELNPEFILQKLEKDLPRV